jgi:hypothetical protein
MSSRSIVRGRLRLRLTVRLRVRAWARARVNDDNDENWCVGIVSVRLQHRGIVTEAMAAVLVSSGGLPST